MAGMNSLSSLLDQLGVGRPLPDGSIWTRARFAKALGLSPSELGVKRAGRRVQQDLALACVWALILDELRTPDGWEVAPRVRALALAIVAARRRARGEEVPDLLELPARLVTWGICPSVESAGVVAEHLMTVAQDRMVEAMIVRGWEGARNVAVEVVNA